MEHIQITSSSNKLLLEFSGSLNLYKVTSLERELESLSLVEMKNIEINLQNVSSIDTACGIFFIRLKKSYEARNINVHITSASSEIIGTLDLVIKQCSLVEKIKEPKKASFINKVGRTTYKNYVGLLDFFNFLGNLFATKLHYLKSIQNIRFKEIAFELNENALKALPIIALTSFLIGLVVAYQSAYQLKIYGANIFLVDMLGISILRELAPLITAIVIAGRSGSAFTAQIGAMKITEELDAMRTMGFDPYIFLVMPRIIALMIAMPLLIFVADIMGILGGMLVASIDLQITPALFIDRFSEAVAAKHFFIGLVKGPFFAFLIATIGIYRGLKVKNDTQSIGFNTTKSVVEAIFAVIVCDALFSIAFTNLGM
ncbi:ABC transporter permease [Sulfurimonas sp. SAG-AH-194-I05]|nr:ABC transporter permease [Sulfurimonas sp. SAG-AH-194-I05]MDF1875525.1 ABC transporter permease [Sulfurimonas sp. SAG-AH-194-I05]